MPCFERNCGARPLAVVRMSEKNSIFWKRNGVNRMPYIDMIP